MRWVFAPAGCEGKSEREGWGYWHWVVEFGALLTLGGKDLDRREGVDPIEGSTRVSQP